MGGVIGLDPDEACFVLDSMNSCMPHKNKYCKECFEDKCNGECNLTQKIIDKQKTTDIA